MAALFYSMQWHRLLSSSHKPESIAVTIQYICTWIYERTRVLLKKNDQPFLLLWFLWSGSAVRITRRDVRFECKRCNCNGKASPCSPSLVVLFSLLCVQHPKLKDPYRASGWDTPICDVTNKGPLNCNICIVAFHYAQVIRYYSTGFTATLICSWPRRPTFPL